MNFQRTGGLILAGVVVLVAAMWLGRIYNAPQAAKSVAATNAARLTKSGKAGPITNAVAGQPPQPTPRRLLPAGATEPASPVSPVSPIPQPAPAGQPSGARPPAVGKAAGTNAPVGKVSTNSLVASMRERLRPYQAKPWFYPAVAAIPLALGAFFLWLTFRSKGAKPAEEATGALVSRVAGKPLKRKAGVAAVQACNVLQYGAEARQVWHFSARGGAFTLGRSQTMLAGERLPASMVAKDWRSLFQPKLNIAWLPAEQVFLRVAQFPKSDFDETLAMIELQLEKLSPMPVTQVVWGVHLLPHAKGNLQTAVLMIAARNAVEEFLGQLEGQGYLADRLELPMLDQLQATSITEDGAWIYPASAGNRPTALVAWWYGGVLQNVDLLVLPSANRSAGLRDQLTQMAWAGEMEGWMPSPPRWHLVADPAVAAEWESELRSGLEQPIEVQAPLAPADLAALTAVRASHSEPRANMLPAEFSTRYQQQFVDGLWMGALGLVLGLYVAGVAVYFVILQFYLMQSRGVENEVAQNAYTYTNALQLKAQFEVLQARQDLKYAGLDCWKAVAELLPSDVTLDSFNFSDGKKLTLTGTAPADQGQALLQFDQAMRKYNANGQSLFDSLKGDYLSSRVNPGGGTLGWGCSYELKRVEVQ